MTGWSRRALIAGGAAAGLGGCMRARPERGLGFWAMSYEGDYAPHLTATFTARTGIPVDVQSLPWTAAHEKLLTAQAGGALPDVIMLPTGWVPEFAMIGALAPVADRRLLADLVPGAADPLIYGGRHQAVPWAVAPQAQFFRRDLLAAVGHDAPPTRWAEWRECARALKRRWPDRTPILAVLNWWDMLFTFAGQRPGRPLRDRDTRGNFAAPGFVEALAFYVSLFAEGLAPRALSTEIQDPISAFAQGRFAIYPYSPELLRDLDRRRGEIAPELWGTARMPGPDGPGPVSGISTCLAVTTQARDRAAAFALVRFLTAPAQELRFQRYIGALPARASAWTAPVLARDPRLRPFAEQLAEPTHEPMVVEWERIRIDVQLVAERVVRGLIPLGQAPAEMNRRVDRILAKRRALVEAGRLA